MVKTDNVVTKSLGWLSAEGMCRHTHRNVSPTCDVSFFTPWLLHRLDRIPSALCSWCGMADGTFFHLMWESLPIRKFWLKVTAFISSTTQIPNICNPLQCLLGYIDDEGLSKNVQTFIHIVLFYAKKSITMHWKSQSSPTIAFWLTTVNHAIPLYKLIYEAGGCPKFFSKIWDSWVSSDRTIPLAPDLWDEAVTLAFVKCMSIPRLHKGRTKQKCNFHVALCLLTGYQKNVFIRIWAMFAEMYTYVLLVCLCIKK